MEKHIKAKKSLGQNFLIDNNIIKKIIFSAGTLIDKNIIEVGPGLGALTKQIALSEFKKLSLVEKDDRAFYFLEDFFRNDSRIKIFNEDALTIDERKFIDLEEKILIISNLPYNISTALLIKWLHNIDIIDKMILMFQKEVAQRIVAKPSSEHYGRLSIISQYLTKAEILFDVAPQCFSPAPKITSSIVKFTPNIINNKVKLPILEKVVRVAFSQRRKMIYKNLHTIINKDSLLKININPEDRAENLTISDYVNIANYLENNDL
jgi:16S rRNA (adenine1518-N6/adenine1519-N6)-dimethyltransferase